MQVFLGTRVRKGAHDVASDKNTSEILYVQTCLSDHRRDVAGMSAEQRGVYESMRVAYFQRGGPLPTDLPTIYRLAEAGTTKERKAVQAALEQKFTLEPDGYHNEFCDAELMRIRTRKLKATTAANARWDGKQGDANAHANASSKHMHGDMLTNNHKPITKNPEPKRLNDVLAEKKNTQPSSYLKEGKAGNDVVTAAPNVAADISDSISSQSSSDHASSSHPSHPPKPFASPPSLPQERAGTRRIGGPTVITAEDVRAFEERQRREEAEQEARREMLFSS